MKNNISVLMSVYYREQASYLDQALTSIFRQTLPPAEVVLVKDGPLGKELDSVVVKYVRAYPEVMKVVSLPENVGLGRALNEGLRHCSNELVARMDSDDIAKAERFEIQVAEFTVQPDLAVVGSWVDEFEEDTENVISIRKLPRLSSELAEYCKVRCPMNHPTVIFRKSIVEQVNGYKDFYLFEDYFLWAKLVIEGYKLYNVPQSLLYFRSNSAMISRRGGWKYAKSEIRLQRKFFEIGLISAPEYIRNIAIRFTVRILPNKIRTFVYKKFLRS